MDTVKKDLRDKMEKLEKMEKEKKKNDDIDIIKTERDFFREEAIRLNELCKELSKVTDNLVRENKAKVSELSHMTKKWKESESVNKQLILELERNVIIIKNYENEKKQFLKMQKYNEIINDYNLNSVKIVDNSINDKNVNNNANNNSNNFYNAINNYVNNSNNSNYSSMPDLNNIYNNPYENNNSNYLKNQNNQNNNLNNLNNKTTNSGSYNNINLNNSSSYNNHNNSTEDIDFLASKNYTSLIFDSKKEKERIINIIEKLRTELRKEKNRNQKIIGEFNKILTDKKKLEKIFVECVEEIRKEILQRKLRDTFHSTKNGFFGLGKKAHSAQYPILNEIQIEHFKATDKKKLVENFLMRNEIINFIKENLSVINTEEKGPFFQKNFSESIFAFRQTKNGNKFDSKYFQVVN